MTKDEYIAWKASRGDDAGKWRYEDCVAADRLIEVETTKAYHAWVRTNIPEPMRGYLVDNASYAYKFSEFSDLLTKLGCYPEWM